MTKLRPIEEIVEEFEQNAWPDLPNNNVAKQLREGFEIQKEILAKHLKLDRLVIAQTLIERLEGERKEVDASVFEYPTEGFNPSLPPEDMSYNEAIDQTIAIIKEILL